MNPEQFQASAQLSADAVNAFFANYDGPEFLIAGLEFESVTSLDALAAAALVKASPAPLQKLSFPSLTTIDTRTAAALAEFRGQDLHLDGIEDLTPDIAAALASTPTASLSLKGVTQLSPETAKALSAFNGGSWLSLDGVNALSPDAARALAACPQRITLNGLTEVSAATLEALSSFAGGALILSGIREIDPEAWNAFSSFRTGYLVLDGIERLPEEGLVALEAFAGDVGLSGLVEATPRALDLLLDDDAIEPLELPRIQSLTPELATAITRHRNRAVELPGVVAIDEEVLATLAASDCIIALDGVRELPPDAASRLEASSISLRLGGLERIVSPLGRYLAAMKGDLTLSANTIMDGESRGALHAKEDLFFEDQRITGQLATLARDGYCWECGSDGFEGTYRGDFVGVRWEPVRDSEPLSKDGSWIQAARHAWRDLESRLSDAVDDVTDFEDGLRTPYSLQFDIRCSLCGEPSPSMNDELPDCFPSELNVHRLEDPPEEDTRPWSEALSLRGLVAAKGLPDDDATSRTDSRRCPVCESGSVTLFAEAIALERSGGRVVGDFACKDWTGHIRQQSQWHRMEEAFSDEDHSSTDALPAKMGFRVGVCCRGGCGWEARGLADLIDVPAATLAALAVKEASAGVEPSRARTALEAFDARSDDTNGVVERAALWLRRASVDGAASAGISTEAQLQSALDLLDALRISN